MRAPSQISLHRRSSRASFAGWALWSARGARIRALARMASRCFSHPYRRDWAAKVNTSETQAAW